MVFRGRLFGEAVCLTAFFAGLGFLGATVFLTTRDFAETFGFDALRAGAFAVATWLLGFADFVFNARVFADFTAVPRAVVRDDERLRPFATLLIV